MAEGCRLYEAVETPVGMALSRDGSSLYVTSAGAVLTLDRDQATGALSPLAGDTGCIQWSRSFRKLAECRPARGMVSPIGVAVSPDDDEVFVAAYGGEARFEDRSKNAASLTMFVRDPATGALRQKPGRAGCISANPDQRGCGHYLPLKTAVNVTLSGDGKSLYVVGAAPGTVLSFDHSTDLAHASGAP